MDEQGMEEQAGSTPPDPEDKPLKPAAEAPPPSTLLGFYEKWGGGLEILILLCLCLAVYAGTLKNGFVYDDEKQILLNPRLESAKHLPSFFTEDVWAHLDPEGSTAATVRMKYYRPWFLTAYYLQYQVFRRTASLWHAFNLLLHILFVVFCLRIALKMGVSRWTALAAASLVAVHPVNSEPVNWLAGQCDLWMAVGLSASFLFYLRFKSRKQIYDAGLSLFFFILALLSKETAVVFPLLPLAHTVIAREKGGWKGLGLSLGMFGMSLVYFVVRTAVVGWIPQSTGQDIGNPLVMGLCALGKYLSLLCCPYYLSASYPKAAGLPGAYALPGILFLLALLVMAVMALRTGRAKTPLFWSGWILVPLLPTLHFGGLGLDFMAERYLYFPSLGFCMLAALALKGLGSRTSRPLLISSLALLPLLGAFAWRSALRTLVWESDLTLSRATVARAPESNAFRFNYALALARDAKDFVSAEREFRLLIKEKPGCAAFHNSYGSTLSSMGRKKEAMMQWQLALRYNPRSPNPAYNLARGYDKTGNHSKALHFYRLFLRNALPHQAKLAQAVRKRTAVLARVVDSGSEE